MASNSSVRFASMFPISLRTSAGSALCWRVDPDAIFAVCWRAGVGDGWGGKPALLVAGPRGGFGEENSVWRVPAPPARVLIVPAFSLAKGSESDSVLELDWKRNYNHIFTMHIKYIFYNKLYIINLYTYIIIYKYRF